MTSSIPASAALFLALLAASPASGPAAEPPSLKPEAPAKTPAEQPAEQEFKNIKVLTGVPASQMMPDRSSWGRPWARRATTATSPRATTTSWTPSARKRPPAA